MFRGREMAHPELGKRILDRIAEQVRDHAVVEAAPRLDGRNMLMVLAPMKKVVEKPAKAKPGIEAVDSNGSGPNPDGEEPPEATAAS